MAKKKVEAEAPKAAPKAEPKKAKAEAGCKHAWVGGSDGVTCKLCGKHLTADEFAAGVK